MKSKCISFFLIGLVGLLFACSSPNNERSDHHQNKATSIEPIEKIDGRGGEVISVGEGEIFTFIGVIEDIHVKSNAALISVRSEEHTSELQSRGHLVCRLLLEKKNRKKN